MLTLRLQDEDAQGWLTSPDVRPADVETTCRHAKHLSSRCGPSINKASQSVFALQDEEAQSWLTSPDVRPADVETAWEAAGRLTELYDEALLHTMRTVRRKLSNQQKKHDFCRYLGHTLVAAWSYCHIAMGTAAQLERSSRIAHGIRNNLA